MSSTSKSSKYIIWLDRLDSFVEEGSGKPSLFDTERAATKCAKELWPKAAWRIKRFSYIKQAKLRQDKKEKAYQKELGTKVTSQGFPYRFKPPTPAKPVCVFLFQSSKERRGPDRSFKSLGAARKWLDKAGKKFLTIDYPDREISILDCTEPNLPTWTDCMYVPADDTDYDNDFSETGRTQPIPHQNSEGRWICPITNKVYHSLGKQLFAHIIKVAGHSTATYLPPENWKAFNHKGSWVCPYTGKVFKRKGKHLALHLLKQRKLLKRS
jgi:hypothetical protein